MVDDKLNSKAILIRKTMTLIEYIFLEIRPEWADFSLDRTQGFGLAGKNFEEKYIGKCVRGKYLAKPLLLKGSNKGSVFPKFQV